MNFDISGVVETSAKVAIWRLAATMHRRAVLELARSQGIDLSCAARCGVARTPRRAFRSSTSRQQSSDDAAANEGDPGAASSQSFPRSKFGGGWRTKQTSKPAELSPAEKAQREALLASQSQQSAQQSEDTQSKETTQPQSGWGSKQPSRPGLSPAEQAQREALLASQPQQRGVTQPQDGRAKDLTEETTRPQSGWRSRQPSKPAGLSPAEQAQRDALLAGQSQQRGNTRPQDASAKDQSGKSDDAVELLPVISKTLYPPLNPQPREPREPSFPRVRRLKQVTVKVPEDLRYIDWTCPNCNTRCFGRNSTCLACNTVRPEIEERYKMPDPPDQSAKIRQLGQSVLSEWDEGRFTERRPGSPVQRKKNRAWKAYRANQDSAGDSVVSGGSAGGHADAPETLPEREAKNQADDSIRQETQEETQDVKDRWQSTAVPEEEDRPSKSSKSRKGRKQRESEFEEDDFDFDEDDRRQLREQRRLKKEKKKEKAPKKQELYLPEFISVSNLADVIGVRPAQFVERLEEMGFDGVTYGHVLDAETAGLIAQEFNFEPIFETEGDDLQAAPEPEDKSVLPPRPPVVTIMGHVDHGKTTILDWLRKSSIAASEHGGITQHIGAFSVSMPSGKTITFLDTPGHAAFLDMRRRGADVTDIVVLVVAVDDSVKPQTIEAIKHAKEANVPMIVAINKIDKDNANPEKVKQDLARHGVDVEDYGGDVQAIPVSGKTGQGMLDLEEAIVTLSEMLDHRADDSGNVEGWVIESSTKASGRVATVLVRRGTMRPGDIVVAGTTWARIRTLKNEAGVTIKEAPPGTPVEIDGWKEQPAAGSEVLQAPSEQKAKDVVEYRLERSETQKLSQDMAAINVARRETLEKRQREASEEDEPLQDEEAQSGPKPVNFLIKADVAGSVEAVVNSVSAVGNNEVYANILRSGVGPVGPFDIQHAATANAHIISFNMPIDPAMSRKAEISHVKIMDHRIIYELIDDVKAKMSEHLAPSVTQRVTGEAEIGQIFNITVKGRETTAIAGCKVRNGVISRSKKVRVLRGQEVIYDGALSSLKNVKKDVTEMRKDTECGMGFEGWTDFAVGDHVQCYEDIYEKRYL